MHVLHADPYSKLLIQTVKSHLHSHARQRQHPLCLF